MVTCNLHRRSPLGDLQTSGPQSVCEEAGLWYSISFALFTQSHPVSPSNPANWLGNTHFSLATSSCQDVADQSRLASLKPSVFIWLILVDYESQRNSYHFNAPDNQTRGKHVAK